jgi:hypothetical protein
MGSRVGCGPLAAIIIILLILVMLGGNEAMGFYLRNCQGVELMDCLMERLEDPEPEPEGSVTATGTYNYKDFSVSVTLQVPLKGGSVTGTVSGSCQGKAQGTYSGQDGGAITGTMTGSCNPFIINIPASATFGGPVNKGGKVIPVSFSGRGAGITHDGAMTLTY